MWGLSSVTGIEPAPSALEGQSLNIWTPREVCITDFKATEQKAKMFCYLTKSFLFSMKYTYLHILAITHIFLKHTPP